MIRTILTFERLGEQTVLKLDRATGDFIGLGDNCPVDLTTLPDGTLVERGAGLVALLQNHRTVRDGLAAALAAPLGSPPSPIYFHVRASSADVVAWELIYEASHGFCALDGRWPVGRIASRSEDLETRVFTPPLRIVAVLSAAARDGRPQLQALADAVDQANAAAVEVGLHVISGDQNVCDEALRHGATTELIKPTAPALARQIADAQPHLLHVLCHSGGTVAGVRTLAFAHSADFDAYEAGDPDALGSVRLPVVGLVAALKPCNPWLAVLSACETALASGQRDGLAVAHEMVCGGLPAVIGMRRLVDLSETDRFCTAFYPQAFAVIRQALSPGGPPGQPQVRTLDWAEALTAPRVVMAGMDPTAVDSWTDPVLYAQDDLLQVFLPSPRLSSADFAGPRGKLDQFRGMLTWLDPATTHPDVIKELQARITELEAAQAQAGL
jgi:hypothetical protein